MKIIKCIGIVLLFPLWAMYIFSMLLVLFIQGLIE